MKYGITPDFLATECRVPLRAARADFRGALVVFSFGRDLRRDAVKPGEMRRFPAL